MRNSSTLSIQKVVLLSLTLFLKLAASEDIEVCENSDPAPTKARSLLSKTAMAKPKQVESPEHPAALQRDEKPNDLAKPEDVKPQEHPAALQRPPQKAKHTESLMCKDFECHCGFTARKDTSVGAMKCTGKHCDWHDRDMCCIGDYDAGDRPDCYEIDSTAVMHLPPLLDPHAEPSNPQWPKMPDEAGKLRWVTTPMLHELGLDACRKCSEAYECEMEDSWFNCNMCMHVHCDGVDIETGRTKLAPYYPYFPSKNTPITFLDGLEDNCACYMSDPNGLGDGRNGCTSVDDWLNDCESDAPDWKSVEDKDCGYYELDMKYPDLFHSASLKADVKKNCCSTWKCIKHDDCPTTTTTPAPPPPPVSQTGCPHDDGCHEVRTCKCYKYVSEFMGFKKFDTPAVEKKIKANCCDSHKLFSSIR